MQEIQEKKVLKLIKKNNNYLCYINDLVYNFTEETILKYHLFVNNKITNINDILLYDEEVRKKIKAINYFIKYPKSIYEAKLIIKYRFKLESDTLINYLLEYNILNDDLLKEYIINSLEKKGYGPYYINNYLYNKGLIADYESKQNTVGLFQMFDKLKSKYKGKNFLKYLLNRGFLKEDIISYFNKSGVLF